MHSMNTFTTRLRLVMLLAVLGVGFAGTAQAQRTVTLRLNAATIPDTLDASSFFEVRGALQNGPADDNALPNGQIIDWNDTSTLEPVNVGGDYWEISFDVETTDTLNFKFYNQQAQDTYGEGWEKDPNPQLLAGTNDTTLTMHYFEFGGGEFQGMQLPGDNYAWRPWEVKEDTVAVWFRVYMDTPEGVADGFVGTSSPRIYAQGEKLGAEGSPRGPLDWSSDSNVTLKQERANRADPGYNLYSGVAYYPASLAGTTQNYKFVVANGTETNYEEGNVSNNRTFVVPAQDSTLYFKNYGNQAPNTGQEPVDGSVIFTVDLSPLEAIGLYDRASLDTLQVRGGFNDWGCADLDKCLLQRVAGTSEYEGIVDIRRIPEAQLSYKFFLDFNNENFASRFSDYDGVPPSGWEEPVSTTGANRAFGFAGEQNQNLGTFFFNDILPNNVVPANESIDLTWRVDMTPAINSTAQPFVAGTDSVFIEFGDPVWGFTQRFELNNDGGIALNRQVQLNRVGTSNIYEGSYTMRGNSYSVIQYKYQYGSNGSYVPEPGEGTSSLGRRRVRFVVPTSGTDYPATYAFTTSPEVYQPDAGSLPYECNYAATGDNARLNPAGCLPSGQATFTDISDLGGIVPTSVELLSSAPNPTNGVTNVTYTVNTAAHVTLTVYDLMGREVAVLVDEVQAASTYSAPFDASRLSAGTYLYRLTTGGQTATRTLTVVR